MNLFIFSESSFHLCIYLALGEGDVQWGAGGEVGGVAGEQTIGHADEGKAAVQGVLGANGAQAGFLELECCASGFNFAGCGGRDASLGGI